MFYYIDNKAYFDKIIAYKVDEFVKSPISPPLVGGGLRGGGCK